MFGFLTTFLAFGSSAMAASESLSFRLSKPSEEYKSVMRLGPLETDAFIANKTEVTSVSGSTITIKLKNPLCVLNALQSFDPDYYAVQLSGATVSGERNENGKLVISPQATVSLEIGVIYKHTTLEERAIHNPRFYPNSRFNWARERVECEIGETSLNSVLH